MLTNLKVRLLLIAGLVLFSLWVVQTRGITYGLDLQGGTQLTMEVRDPEGALSPEQREDAIDRALRVIRSRVDALGVAEPSIQKAGRDRIVVELPGATRDEQQRAREVLERTAFLSFQIVRPQADLESAMPRIDRAAAGVPGEPISAGRPTPTSGALVDTIFSPAAGEATVRPLGSDSAGSSRTSTIRPFSDRLHPQPGDAGIFFVPEQEVPSIESYLGSPQVLEALPRGVELRWDVTERPVVEGYQVLYLLDADALITGEHLVDAQAQRDEMGQPIVAFEFSRRGGLRFEDGTRRNVGNLMAIVLDDRVMSAPVIQEPIASRGRITMSGAPIAEARDLALVLRAG
ncbi:MAG TPA: hypothetical protein VMN39_06670, partial [Longimicrobiaceae bacterium]|nr:hypothetical protein [Longimicrobiaceae bacterium]